MPRIRTLKPEHKQHRKVGLLTDRQYRLWVGMITEADDEGRLVADPAQLRVLIFAYQPRTTVTHVADGLEALAAVGLLRLYRVGEVNYAEFTSWRDHQRVQHPAPSKYPPHQHSDTPHEDSRALMSVHGGSEGIKDQGREGIEALSGKPDATPHNGHAHQEHAREILDFLNSKAQRRFQPVPENLNLIAARLRAGATIEDCRGVIARKVRAWATDPKMSGYLRPATLFNATKFAQYVGEQGT